LFFGCDVLDKQLGNAVNEAGGIGEVSEAVAVVWVCAGNVLRKEGKQSRLKN
jgi:hypothetical protein